MVVRGQLRVGAADLQCGVAVETVDSQNPSSYVDYIHVSLYVCVRGVCARARAHAVQRLDEKGKGREGEGGQHARAECGYYTYMYFKHFYTATRIALDAYYLVLNDKLVIF